MKRLALGTVIWLLFAGMSPLRADTIDFTIDVFAPGSISFSPNHAHPHPGAIGSVAVDLVLGVSTPKNAGDSFEVLNGLLKFTTGNLIGFGKSDWLFGSGGTISITGCVDTDNDRVCDPSDPQGTLLTGTFTSAQVDIETGKNPGRFLSFKTIGGTFTDSKNPGLQLLFFPNTFSRWNGDLGINFGAPGAGKPPLGFKSSSIFGGSVPGQPKNVGVVNTPIVPEPGTLTLLGTGVLSIAAMIRRRRKS